MSYAEAEEAMERHFVFVTRPTTARMSHNCHFFRILGRLPGREGRRGAVILLSFSIAPRYITQFSRLPTRYAWR